MHHSASPNDGASIDPVTFEVIYHGLDSVVNEMALTVMRTAYSGIVKDSMDYSTAFCDARGNVIAQGLTIIVHLNSFPDAVAAILTGYGDRMEPGDIFVANDPYGSGGIHLPDIFVIKPIFIDGELEGFTGSTAHHTDVGGLVPGSNSTDSTEIYQEGIRIPHPQAVRPRCPERNAVRHHRKERQSPPQGPRRYQGTGRSRQHGRARVSRSRHPVRARDDAQLPATAPRLHRRAGPGRDSGDAGRQIRVHRTHRRRQHRCGSAHRAAGAHCGW